MTKKLPPAETGHVALPCRWFERLLQLGLARQNFVPAGFVAPFVFPHLKWDFRLKNVVSINVSGHKYASHPTCPQRLSARPDLWQQKEAGRSMTAWLCHLAAACNNPFKLLMHPALALPVPDSLHMHPACRIWSVVPGLGSCQLAPRGTTNLNAVQEHCATA